MTPFPLLMLNLSLQSSSFSKKMNHFVLTILTGRCNKISLLKFFLQMFVSKLMHFKTKQLINFSSKRSCSKDKLLINYSNNEIFHQFQLKILLDDTNDNTPSLDDVIYGSFLLSAGKPGDVVAEVKVRQPG